MPDGRKEIGRKNGKRGIGFVMAKEKVFKEKKQVGYRNFRVKVKRQFIDDWEVLQKFGFTGSKVFEEGVKSCMNQLAVKRVDEQLYGEFEAFVMYRKRNTQYGLKLESLNIRHKLHHNAKLFSRISIIGLQAHPSGDNYVSIRYYKINKDGLIKRNKIHSMKKKVEKIDKEILLFFANGGVHQQ